MTVLFKEVPVGARFEFRGRRYTKVALSMAHDEERWGNIFQDHAEVVQAQELRVENGGGIESGGIEESQRNPSRAAWIASNRRLGYG